jgi:hypothetical protein
LDGGEVDGPVGELGGGEGGDGGGIEDGVNLFEGEGGAGGGRTGMSASLQRGIEEGLGVVAIAAADGFKADGVETGGAEGAQEEAGEVGFADVGVGAGDEIAHGEAALCEALKVGK